MHDLLHFALAVYTIDQTISRPRNGFQGWSRNLKVYFPVNNRSVWKTVQRKFENYLGFLSGDKWEFEFRQNHDIRTVTGTLATNPSNHTKVCLLSGGLDSFIAAIDLLSNQNEKPAFVSHYKTGTESSAQDRIINALKENFGENRFSTNQFYVQPNQKNASAQRENSSRARSLLFICLGLSVANSLGDHLELVLPENGLISLNIPLTKTRLSSHSTRTTHPYFVDGLNQILADLGLSNKVVNPYRFKTKGEMMVNCKNQEFLHQFAQRTVSCSHPENSRYAGKPPGLNCGYCVPCIIRQAAEHKAGEINTEYALDDIRRTPPSQKQPKGSDYRAFRLALERIGQITRPHSFALEVIRSGPIPAGDDFPFNEYVEVYKRGMEEVKSFFNS